MGGPCIWARVGEGPEAEEEGPRAPLAPPWRRAAFRRRKVPLAPFSAEDGALAPNGLACGRAERIRGPVPATTELVLSVQTCVSWSDIIPRESFLAAEGEERLAHSVVHVLARLAGRAFAVTRQRSGCVQGCAPAGSSEGLCSSAGFTHRSICSPAGPEAARGTACGGRAIYAPRGVASAARSASRLCVADE